MNLKTVVYNNSLLYLAALENNFELVNNLFEKGFPKSLSHLPGRYKKNINHEELRKLRTSYNNATHILLRDLLRSQRSIPMLRHCLELLFKNEKLKDVSIDMQAMCGFAFFYGNIAAFELFCSTFNKDEICENQNLLWYIHQARRNKALSKKTRAELCSYIEKLGLDWSKAKLCLIRWSNMNRNIDDFKYFYNKRKSSLKGHPQKTQILKKELSKAIESFLMWSVAVEINLNSSIIEYIANRSEFKRSDPYEGYWIVLRKCYRISTYHDIDKTFIEEYFQKLVNKYPDIALNLTKTKIKVPQLNATIEKIQLRQKLFKNLPSSLIYGPVKKI